MKVLLLGGGGREHALAWALARPEFGHEVHAAPGNPGVAAHARCWPVGDAPDDHLVLARQLQPDLVLIGPEAPLALGSADVLRAAGFAVFGPGRQAARIETDKAWSKAFMQRHGIPTARYRDVRAAEDIPAALRLGLPLVVKDTALKAGKGVTIAHDAAEAVSALHAILNAGGAAVAEEFMTGQECTVLTLCDGERAAPLPPAQDHKTIFEGDTGPMTGGMGVVAPYPLSDAERAAVRGQILEPTLAGLRAEGTPFVGCLYLGLMLTADGPRVVEFNARFGDPEAQAVLPLLQSDLAAHALACARGELNPGDVVWGGASSAVVVLAAPGYPGTPQTGIPLVAPEVPPGSLLFHAGTRERDGELLSSGGRVFAAQALGADLPEALARAHALADAAEFPGAQRRRDIGFRLGLAPRGG